MTTMALQTMTASSQDRFMALLERHGKIVFKIAGIYCWHADDRRDLMQEITAQLWRSFASYDEARPFTTWMYRVALNVAISYVRSAVSRRKYVVSLEDHAIDPIDPLSVDQKQDGDARVDAMRRVIARLNELDRALLLLYLEEHSYRDISDVLGISETNVATKISRLKRRMRKEIVQ